MLKKLKESFDTLQTLEIQPTLQNMEKLVTVLYNLREIYQELEKGEEHGQEADPEQRDDH